MVYSPVTRPAVPAVSIHYRYHTLVTPETILLNNFFPVTRYTYPLRIYTRMEHQQVFHPVNTLPDEIPHPVIIRKMTIDTFNISMKTVHKPRFIFLIHHMTGIAVIRLGCFMQHIGRAPHNKYKDKQSSRCRDDVFSIIFHIHLSDVRLDLQ